MNDKQFRFKKRDEYYTPRLLVEPIIEYLKPGSTIWCPFDTENSEFVLVLKEFGFKVIFSHIIYGLDFFKYTLADIEYFKVDYIISNPPFSIKMEIFEKLEEFNKPYAMLMGLPVLNYQIIGNFFLDKKLQLLIFNKKVSFDGNPSSFNTSYFCKDILPRDLMFKDLPHNNTKGDYVESRMKKEITNLFIV